RARQWLEAPQRGDAPKGRSVPGYETVARFPPAPLRGSASLWREDRRRTLGRSRPEEAKVREESLTHSLSATLHRQGVLDDDSGDRYRVQVVDRVLEIL